MRLYGVGEVVLLLNFLFLSKHIVFITMTSRVQHR